MPEAELQILNRFNLNEKLHCRICRHIADIMINTFDDIMSLSSDYDSDSEEAPPVPKKRPLPVFISPAESPPHKKGPRLSFTASSSDEKPPAEVQQRPPPPSPPRPGVAYCKCRMAKGSKVCTASCHCLIARIECGRGCGCNGDCANGQLSDRDDKLYLAPSTIAGAGQGGFASAALAKDEIVGEYRGEILSNTMEKARKRRSAYVAFLDSPGTMVIDGEFGGSKVTRINHPGLTRSPNVIALRRQVRVANNSRLSWGLFLKATKAIPAKVELFWDYGPGYPIDNFA